MAPEHILVVEDEPDIQELVAELLSDAGYTVATAADGAQALAYLAAAEVKPDLILLDLMMPTMDGVQFRAEQLKHPEHAAIPVAVVSAHADGKALAASMSAAGFARKPFDADTLYELVAAALHHPPPTQVGRQRP